MKTIHALLLAPFLLFSCAGLDLMGTRPEVSLKRVDFDEKGRFTLK